MIVMDASAMVEVLLRGPGSDALLSRLSHSQTLHAPHLLDLEVVQVIRRFVAAGELAVPRAGEALEDLADFPLRRHPHDVLLPRIWGLRQNLTAYDAAYVALAEALDAPLVTRDRKLAHAPGHEARVEVV